MNKGNFKTKYKRGAQKKNTNLNTRVNEFKARFGAGYDYRFLELDNLQREFYYEIVRRENQEKKEKARRGKK